MKRILFLISTVLLGGCYDIERNCNDFRTGEFEFDYVIDGETKTGRFTRNDTLSISYYEGKTDSSYVRWINDCEFILKTINPKSNAEKDALHMKILTTEGTSSYTFEYKLAIKKPNRPQRIEKGIAYKIN